MGGNERARKKERLKKEAQKRRHEAEKTKVLKLQKNGQLVRRYLTSVGKGLPFYEFLDSYRSAFDSAVSEAGEKLPSLLGVHELEMAEYQNPDLDKIAPGRGHLITFQSMSNFPDYGTRGYADSNLIGHTNFFMRSDGSITSLVLLPRNPRSTMGAPELKYAFKLATLYHELGHVDDAERRINIDPATGRFDLIEAEVFANLTCLTRLADMAMKVMYDTVYDALVKAAESSGDGYLRSVARLVIERQPRRSVSTWQDLVDDDEIVDYGKRIGFRFDS